jgi:hypothetical protein
MTNDLRTQVRDYTEFFVSTVESIDLDEIRERPIGIGEGPVRPIRPLAPSSPRRGWLVAVAAAAAVLVLVGGAALLLRVTGSDSPVATTPQIDSLSSLTWSRVPHDEAVFGGPLEQRMFDVTAGGPGLVAVGLEEWPDIGTPSAPAPPSGAVWTSPDGITWSRVPHDEAVFDRASMSSVTAEGPGLVAVGSTSMMSAFGRSAAVWTSPDGITWSRVPHDEAVFGGAGISSVTAGGPGLVAVGGVGPDAAVWTSADGITWSRVRYDEAVFGGDASNSISSVSAAGTGLVAVGDGADGAAVWTSPDGITWARVPHDEEVFGGDGGMSSVTSGGPGLVVVGHAGGNAAVWVALPED